MELVVDLGLYLDLLKLKYLNYFCLGEIIKSNNNTNEADSYYVNL
jgi:hypothetical protein